MQLRFLICLPTVLCAAACAASPEPDGATAPETRDAASDAPPPESLTRDAGANDAAPRPNGALVFTVNGRRVEASEITLEERSGYATLRARADDPDGLHWEAVTLQFSVSSKGAGACGSILSLPDRAVTYGRYFLVNGQVATDKQFLSGLPGTATSCTFTVDAVEPAAGKVEGSLASEKVLIGGGAVPPPVNVTITWSGVARR